MDIMLYSEKDWLVLCSDAGAQFPWTRALGFRAILGHVTRLDPFEIFAGVVWVCARRYSWCFRGVFRLWCPKGWIKVYASLLYSWSYLVVSYVLIVFVFLPDQLVSHNRRICFRSFTCLRRCFLSSKSEQHPITVWLRVNDYRLTASLTTEGNTNNLFAEVKAWYRWIFTEPLRRGKYPPLFNDTEANNCFGIYNTSLVAILPNSYPLSWYNRVRARPFSPKSRYSPTLRRIIVLHTHTAQV